MEAILKWWDSKSSIYTHYTKGEIVMAHLCMLVILIACGVAEYISA